jgi:hypothetical protein
MKFSKAIYCVIRGENMLLTDEEWEKVKIWLESFRFCCRKEEIHAKHPKAAQFYKDVNVEVREFLFSKDENK